MLSIFDFGYLSNQNHIGIDESQFQSEPQRQEQKHEVIIFGVYK